MFQLILNENGNIRSLVKNGADWSISEDGISQYLYLSYNFTILRSFKYHAALDNNGALYNLKPAQIYYQNFNTD